MFLKAVIVFLVSKVLKLNAKCILISLAVGQFSQNSKLFKIITEDKDIRHTVELNRFNHLTNTCCIHTLCQVPCTIAGKYSTW